MSKKEFWIRLFFYIIFGGIIPFVFLVWRFDLFSKVNSVSIGGWGIVAITFIGIFFIKLMKSVKKGLPFSYATQIIEGICKVIIPLLIAAFCCYYLEDLMYQVFQFICVLIVSETIAILVNPIPQWAHDNKISEEQQSLKTLISSLSSTKTEDGGN